MQRNECVTFATRRRVSRASVEQNPVCDDKPNHAITWPPTKQGKLVHLCHRRSHPPLADQTKALASVASDRSESERARDKLKSAEVRPADECFVCLCSSSTARSLGQRRTQVEDPHRPGVCVCVLAVGTMLRWHKRGVLLACDTALSARALHKLNPRPSPSARCQWMQRLCARSQTKAQVIIALPKSLANVARLGDETNY